MFIDEQLSQIFRQINIALMQKMENERYMSVKDFRILISSDLLRLMQAGQLITPKYKSVPTLYGVIVEEGRNLPEMSFMIAKEIHKIYLEE